MYLLFITFGCCSLVIVDVVFWNKYSIVNENFSPGQFWVDFGNVVLQKFVLLLIPSLLLYQFFPGSMDTLKELNQHRLCLRMTSGSDVNKEP